MRKLMGALLSSSAFGYVAWGVLYGNPAKSPVGPLIFAGLMLGGGASLLLSGRKKTLTAKAEAHASIEEQVLFLAKGTRGHATAAEIAADASFSFEEVQAELDRLTTLGRCELLVTEEGLCVYHFAEFADDSEVSEAQRIRASRTETLRR